LVDERILADHPGPQRRLDAGLATQFLLLNIAHRQRGLPRHPALRGSRKPSPRPPGRILPGQMQRRLEPARMRLTVLVAGNQQPPALARALLEKRALLGIWLEEPNLPAELPDVGRRLKRLQDALQLSGGLAQRLSHGTGGR